MRFKAPNLANTNQIDTSSATMRSKNS